MHLADAKPSWCPCLSAALGQPVTAKVIRNRTTQRSEGYGFIEFATVEAAEAFLRTFNGCAVPNTDQVFRLGRATFGRRGLTEGALADPVRYVPHPAVVSLGLAFCHHQ